MVTGRMFLASGLLAVSMSVSFCAGRPSAAQPSEFFKQFAVAKHDVPLLADLCGLCVLNRSDQPDLYKLVAELAADQGILAPRIMIFTRNLVSRLLELLVGWHGRLMVGSLALTQAKAVLIIGDELLRGLDKDQLEVCLAHELVYLNRRYGLKRVVLAVALLVGALVLYAKRSAAPAGALLTKVSTTALMTGYGVLAVALLAAWSRSQAYAADEATVERFGGPKRMLDLLKRQEALQMPAASIWSWLCNIMRFQPAPDARLLALTELVA